MKIKIFVASATILLVIVYFLVWQIKPFEYGETSEFVPATALLYAEQKDVEAFLDDLQNSKLGRAIQSIDYLKIGKEIDLKNEDLTLLKKITNVIKNNWDSEIIKELFGEKVALALLQPQRATGYLNLVDFFKANTVLITQPKHKAEILQIIIERYAAYTENITISTHQYGQHHIKRISIDDEIFSIVVLNGMYLISFEEQQLRRCIDTFDNELASLPENVEYATLREHYPDPDQFAFLSLKNSRDFVAKHLPMYDFSGRDIVEKEIAASIGFSGFSYGAWKEQSLIKDRIMILHNHEIANSFVEKQLKLPPSICDTLQFSPQDPLVFYWTNILDFESLYRFYNEKVPRSNNKISELFKTHKGQSGEIIDQFFAQLGKEFSYIITAGKENNFLSIPSGIMMFKIQDREKLGTLIKKLLSIYGFSFKKKTHGSTLYYSWKDSPQDGLEPLYGFLENYLFIGNSSSLANHIIDNSINGGKILRDPYFMEVDTGLTEPNNYVSYTNNAELINIIKSLFTLASTIVAIEDKAAAKKITILTKDVATPLLDGLSMFERTTTRSYFTKDSVVIDSMTKVAE